MRAPLCYIYHYYHVPVMLQRGRLMLMKTRPRAPKAAGSRRERGAAVGIDECVNSEAVGLSCSENYVALAEKFQINARSGNMVHD